MFGEFEIRLLGGFELQRDGRTVEVPGSAQRLLGFLALQDRPVPRGFVAESLWPETSDQKASANLRTALWRLNRPELAMILTGHNALSLNGAVWVDARAVRAASVQQRRFGRLPEDDLLLDIRGELLPGCWDGWLIFERERLRQETVLLCEATCARLLETGDAGRAVLHALTAVACEPLRETANLWLVKAHLACGNRSAAVRHARSYASLLETELGLPPPEELDEVLWLRERRPALAAV
jgi:DNA-binding SARP family transcriptional activator